MLVPIVDEVNDVNDVLIEHFGEFPHHRMAGVVHDDHFRGGVFLRPGCRTSPGLAALSEWDRLPEKAFSFRRRFCLLPPGCPKTVLFQR